MKHIFFLSGIISLFLIAHATSAQASPEIEKGKEIYNGMGGCMVCHGPEGAGDGPASATLDPKPANFKKGNYRIDANGAGSAGTEESLFNVITNGAQAYGGSMLMAGFSHLSETDRRALVKFVLSLKE